MKKNTQKREQAFALLVVIPIVLILAMIGLVFVSTVRHAVQSQADHLSYLQSRYMAKSALQLALLERQPRIAIRRNIGRGTSALILNVESRFPRQAKVYFAEHPLQHIYEFEYQDGNRTINLLRNIQHDVPSGTTIYLVHDLDGDGKMDSISERNLFGGQIKVSSEFISHDALSEVPYGETIQYQAHAAVGISQCMIEAIVRYP